MGTASCTVKHFPFTADHTVSWAKAAFEKYFEQDPKLANQYLDSPSTFADLLLQNPVTADSNIEVVKRLVSKPPTCWSECCQWAVRRYAEFFDREIRDLVHAYPEDHTKSNGEKLWAAPKRFPHPHPFNPNDKDCVSFVLNAARLKAKQFGITPGSVSECIQVATSEKLPVWQPSKLEINEEEDTSSTGSEPSDISPESIKAKVAEIPVPANTKFRLFADKFEKDDDSNHHMAFITAAANLRNENYRIERISQYDAKGIAGKIIPAIATTTAFVAGMVCLELYKYLGGHKDIESYANVYTNLAIPVLQVSEPPPPAKYPAPWKSKANPDDPEPVVTEWDLIAIEDAATLGQVLEKLKTQYKFSDICLNANIGSGVMIHMDFMPKKARMNMTIDKIVEQITKTPLPESVIYIPITIAADVDGQDVGDLPTLRYKIPGR